MGELRLAASGHGRPCKVLQGQVLAFNPAPSVRNSMNASPCTFRAWLGLSHPPGPAWPPLTCGHLDPHPRVLRGREGLAANAGSWKGSLIWPKQRPRTESCRGNEAQVLTPKSLSCPCARWASRTPALPPFLSSQLCLQDSGHLTKKGTAEVGCWPQGWRRAGQAGRGILFSFQDLGWQSLSSSGLWWGWSVPAPATLSGVVPSLPTPTPSAQQASLHPACPPAA